MSYHIEDGRIRVVFKREINLEEMQAVVQKIGGKIVEPGFTGINLSAIIEVPTGAENEFADKFLREASVASADTIIRRKT